MNALTPNTLAARGPAGAGVPAHRAEKEESVGKRESYEPGTFCWLDLSTSDAEGAKAFYGALFGWEFEDAELPGGGVYTMCRLGGDDVAAIVQQDQQPGHWNNYVSVAGADETAAKAKRLGAAVFEEPFDVMDAGRMAVFADPTGAALCAWEPKGHIGAGRVNDPGCLAWNELQTRDAKGAAGFYAELFGWEMEVAGDAEAPEYVVIHNRGKMNGGIMPMSEAHGDAPPHWLPYFTVTSADEAAEKARALGGAVMLEPANIGGGRIAVLADGQGVAFAVFEGETDD